MSNRTGLFVLPVNEAFLVCSPLNGIAALLNASALKMLRRRMQGCAFSATATVNELADLLAQNPSEPPSLTGPLKPLFLGLLPTRRCNCSCVYCDFDAGAEKTSDMSPATATAALDWYARFLRETGQNHLELHFFGGEPFVCREVVETAVHCSRMLASRHELSLHLEVSTNGLFEQEYAQFVGDYFQAVLLSLDGFQDIHDRHRPIHSGRGSFSQARQTATLLAQTPTELCLRCCVSNLNIHCLEEIALWFCEEFQPSVINFEPLSANPQSRVAGLSAPDPYTFALQYTKARAQALRYGIQTVYAATEGEPAQTRFCPVGKDALIVSPDGRISSCYLPRESWLERGLDMELGHLSGQREVHIDPKAVLRLRSLTRDKPRCARCFCQWVCSGGCHVQHSYPGSSLAYEPFCIQTRLLSACRLLEEMNLPQIAQSLLADRKAMEALALQGSDIFEAEE
jgi:uncharacterized protein